MRPARTITKYGREERLLRSAWCQQDSKRSRNKERLQEVRHQVSSRPAGRKERCREEGSRGEVQGGCRGIRRTARPGETPALRPVRLCRRGRCCRRQLPEHVDRRHLQYVRRCLQRPLWRWSIVRRLQRLRRLWRKRRQRQTRGERCRPAPQGSHQPKRSGYGRHQEVQDKQIRHLSPLPRLRQRRRQEGDMQQVQRLGNNLPDHEHDVRTHADTNTVRCLRRNRFRHSQQMQKLRRTRHRQRRRSGGGKNPRRCAGRHGHQRKGQRQRSQMERRAGRHSRLHRGRAAPRIAPRRTKPAVPPPARRSYCHPWR